MNLATRAKTVTSWITRHYISVQNSCQPYSPRLVIGRLSWQLLSFIECFATKNEVGFFYLFGHTRDNLAGKIEIRLQKVGADSRSPRLTFYGTRYAGLLGKYLIVTALCNEKMGAALPGLICCTKLRYSLQ